MVLKGASRVPAFESRPVPSSTYNVLADAVVTNRRSAAASVSRTRAFLSPSVPTMISIVASVPPGSIHCVTFLDAMGLVETKGSSYETAYAIIAFCFLTGGSLGPEHVHTTGDAMA